MDPKYSLTSPLLPSSLPSFLPFLPRMGPASLRPKQHLAVAGDEPGDKTNERTNACLLPSLPPSLPRLLARPLARALGSDTVPMGVTLEAATTSLPVRPLAESLRATFDQTKFDPLAAGRGRSVTANRQRRRRQRRARGEAKQASSPPPVSCCLATSCVASSLRSGCDV